MIGQKVTFYDGSANRKCTTFGQCGTVGAYSSNECDPDNNVAWDGISTCNLALHVKKHGS